MDINFSDADLAFREQVRAFLEKKFPADIRKKIADGVALTKDDTVRWQKILHAQGWAAPNWPVEHGGTGWTSTQKYIFFNEMANVDAPVMVAFGVTMVAPVIMKYGSEEQKKRFLPDILASNVWWCQGYSEPGSGSDLASLRTRAVREGDHYVVNGIKAWTTLAQHADWIFCLVRTDESVKKQQGISFLLIDMKTPGVSVHPVITLEGGHEVNETHFENVRVPVENLIGEENKGWTYAKALLTHERTNIAGVANSKRRLAKLQGFLESVDAGDGTTLAASPDFKRKLAALEIDLLALEYTELRTLAAVATGGAPGPESSILKIKGTEIQQALTELALEASGYYGFPFSGEYEDGAIGPAFTRKAAWTYFNHRKATIYGGSSEVQRNIIAKAVLGL